MWCPSSLVWPEGSWAFCGTGLQGSPEAKGEWRNGPSGYQSTQGPRAGSAQLWAQWNFLLFNFSIPFLKHPFSSSGPVSHPFLPTSGLLGSHRLSPVLGKWHASTFTLIK